MHSYVCPNKKKKRKECVYARLGRCIQSCTSMSKEKRVCVPESGSIYIAKEVTNVDSKYIVCGEVSYDERMTNDEKEKWGKPGQSSLLLLVYNDTI